MRWIHRTWMQLQTLFVRGRQSARLDDELQFHLDQQIAENLAAGMSADEARHAAMRSFGNPTLLRDQSRETWSWGWLESFAHEIRYGIRTLARTPGFSIVAILVMALGIGANVALFTVVRSVLLKPLPFKDQNRLVRIYEADAHGAFQDSIVAGGSFASWQSQAHSFEQMAITQQRDYNLSGAHGQLPEVIAGGLTSWNLFPLLGVRPSLGRFFLASEDRSDGNAAVVLSWGLWKRRYGGDPAILGKNILLDAKSYTVVGILPAAFNYSDKRIQLWTALYHEKPADLMQMHAAHNFDVVARLKPGVSIAQATADLNTIQSQIRKQFPDGPVDDAANIRPLLDAQVHAVKASLYAMLAATGCLLLIACLNIANLLVARAASRRRETAIRTALGGSRMRLVREQVIESVLLAAAGGTLGILFAAATLQWLISARDDIPRTDAIHIDGIVVLFAIGIMLVCGLLAGLIPALSTSNPQILKALQESSRAHSGGKSGVRLRRFLLALEVGLTVVLLIGAGLLIKSYHQLRSVDLGCATRNMLTMEINLPKLSYSAASKRVSFYEQLLERTQHLPGVRAAGLATALPGQGRRRDDVFTISEHPPLPKGQVIDALTRFVDPGFFTAMQIPLLQGRFLQPNEQLEHGQSVVISQALVNEYFPAEDPIGKHIKTNIGNGDQSFEIVGVVADTLAEVSGSPRPAIFYPLYLGSERSSVLAVRTKSSDPAAVALPVQQIIASLDRDLPVANIMTMDQIIGQSTLNASFDAKLLLAFAILSLTLAAAGLFGVLSYIVAQRTTEIGIRIALGAQREQVMRLILRDGLRPALFGLVLGLIASVGVTRLIQSMLYGTHPLDPVVFIVVSAVLLLVAALACAIPAWHASQLDPIQALRTE